MNLKDLVIGIPYEIEIEPSVDLGDFRAELCMKGSGVNYHINLVRNEGFKHTLIMPNIFETDKSEFEYKIFLYKDNACFEVDSGTINIIKDIQNNKSKKQAPTAKITITKKDDEPKEELNVEEDKKEDTTVGVKPSDETLIVPPAPVVEYVLPTEKPARTSILKQITDTSKKKQKINNDVKNIIKDLKSVH